MKAKIQALFLIVFCVGMITGCGVNDEDDDYYSGTMQARVNDELIIFDEAYGDRVLTWDWEWTDIQSIIGKKETNTSGATIYITFSFIPVTGTTFHPSCYYSAWNGSQDIDHTNVYYTKSMNTSYSEFSSTVTITSVANNRYKGTFSFKAYDDTENPADSVVVINGEFEIDSDGKKW